MPAEHDPMDLALALQRAAREVESVHHFHGAECLCGFMSNRARSRTEHITRSVVDHFNRQGADDARD